MSKPELDSKHTLHDTTTRTTYAFVKLFQVASPSQLFLTTPDHFLKERHSYASRISAFNACRTIMKNK